MFTIDDIIDLAVRIERNGEKILRQAQAELSDQALVSLLKWMENEERQHAEWFARLRPVVLKNSDMRHLKEMGQDLLADLLGDQGFSLGDADFSTIPDIKGLVSTLVEFENDTVLFYQLIRSAVTDDKTLNLLDRIISEEENHAQRLKTFVESDPLSL